MRPSVVIAIAAVTALVVGGIFIAQRGPPAPPPEAGRPIDSSSHEIAAGAADSHATPPPTPTPAVVPVSPKIGAPTGRSDTTRAAPVAAPHLDRLTPDSAIIDQSATIELQIRGSGFTPAGNDIAFGRQKAGTAKSTDGRHLTVYMPLQLRASSEAPPAMLSPGQYSVTVTNAHGVSNALTFTLRNGAP